MNVRAHHLRRRCAPSAATRARAGFARRAGGGRTGAIGGLLLTVLAVLAVSAVPAWGQSGASAPRMADLIDRPVAEVRIEGLNRVPEQLVRNQIRTGPGDPFDPASLGDDLERIRRLGEFRLLQSEAELASDGSVVVTIRVTEQPIILVIQVVGNSLVSNEDLRARIPFAAGLPRDDFLIENAVRGMEQVYRDRGNYLATVVVDESQLEESGVLIFQVIEGPRVKIKSIEFETADAFPYKQLRKQIRTNTAIPLLRRGRLDESVLLDDVARLDRFYKDRGYLDVRVDRRIELSPNNKEAKVVFLIDEGRRYTVREIRGQAAPGRTLNVLSSAQLAALLELKPGDAFTQDLVRKSRQVIRDAYGAMGYLDTRVSIFSLRVGPQPEVDVVVEISEGERSLVDTVTIQGNFLTKDKVARRLVRLDPGRPFDGREIEDARRRLERSRLFGNVRLTVLDEKPEDPGYRDVLVEVDERNTGSFNFGAAIGSDSGLFGEFIVRQDNFDIADTPESFNEWLRGRSFRGAGQRFQLAIRPGVDVSDYSISLTEPYFLESDWSLRVSSFLRQRDFSAGDYDEDRVNFSVGVGRRLGDIWTLNLDARAERIELEDIDPDSPVEFFESAGPDTLTSVQLSLVRTTADNLIRPREGSRLRLSVDQIGALGGDYTFTNLNADYTVFFTLDEDFLGRRSTLRLNARTNYLLNGEDAPIYERLYLGGRNFRGFDFRGVSPRGINRSGQLTDDPTGGEWLFFLGAQYEFPILEDAIKGVAFIDSGTVVNDIGFDDYRVSVGLGARLYLPAFGEAPLAFDFGFPLRSEEGDDEQVFSFSVDLPFR